jgi:hypothetical protein
MADTVGGRAALGVDETKVYIVRRKADGHRYKIFHDGREELIDEDAERRATSETDEPISATPAKEQ